MSQRPPRPAGMPWLSPYLVVQNADAARDFYQRAFGFETKMLIPGPDGKGKHVEMIWKDAVIMFAPESPESPFRAPATLNVPSPVGLFLYCDDVDALFARATAAGAQVKQPPQDMFWGDRTCTLTDPDGHVWSFATNVADFDPANVPH
jgi:PhnB protein